MTPQMNNQVQLCSYHLLTHFTHAVTDKTNTLLITYLLTYSLHGAGYYLKS